ncbi:MAG: PorT family protein [Bacteroidetes bacterium]|nr:MAG: PorT family protein [Bacteroidota bacterium]
MKKNLFFILFLSVFQSFAQENKNTLLDMLLKIPFKPSLDLGFNQLQNLPTNMDLDWSGSRGVNLNLMFKIRLVGGTFTLNPGVGIAHENYAFAQKITVSRNSDGTVGILPLNYDQVSKTKLSANYIDFPLELRYATSRGRKSFRFTAGAKLGFLFNNYTKISYTQNNKESTLELNDDVYLNPIRYGIYGRIGYNWISFYAYYGLSDFFQKSRWNPDQRSMNAVMFGLSFVSF